ncbi:hypothetical protein TRVA0_020S00122 [Trichomonascus vanleenenianus]|uniref:Zn(II)2Cys6 transcription factor n=1 Tax=Trichomonascus vanleenenianus TaxID=2268995 RepID=UPI003EC9C2E2
MEANGAVADSQVRKSRACRACENCRKRKVKCSGGDTCSECRRFNVPCVYRQHYRAKKGFSIKILQSPDFSKKPRKSSVGKVTKQQRSGGAAAQPPSSLNNAAPPAVSANINGLLACEGAGTQFSSDSEHKVEPEELAEAQPVSSFNFHGPSFLSKLHLYCKSLDRFVDGCDIEISPRAQALFEEIKQSPRFVPQLLQPHQLAQVRDRHLTEEQMLQCLCDYFSSYHIMLPMLDPDTWIRRAKSLWRSRDYGTALKLSNTELAIIYLIIALGSLGSFANSFAGIEDTLWAEEYSRKAQELLPNPFIDVSVATAQVLVLMTVYSAGQGHGERVYYYTGHAVRICLARKLHTCLAEGLPALGMILDVDDASSTTSSSKPGSTIDDDERELLELYEKHRTWVCCYTLEQFWSYCMNLPSSLNPKIELPQPYAPAFTNSSMYNMGVEHIKLRLWYTRLAAESIAPLDGPEITETVRQDILGTYHKVRAISHEVDQCMNKAKDAYLNQDDISGFSLSESQIKEWYWLRLFYWNLKLVLYRPFFLLNMYLDFENSDTSNIPPAITEALYYSSKKCLEAAMAIPPIVFVIDERLERCQINWFSSSYLEASCPVLFLYLVCRSPSVHDANEIEPVRKMLHRVLAHLNGEKIGGNKIVSGSTLDSLHALMECDLTLYRTMAHNRCTFTRIFFNPNMPLVHERKGDALLDVMEMINDYRMTYQPGGALTMELVEGYWLRSLDLVGFR